MLDHTQPSARQLAQLRMAAKVAGIPDALADTAAQMNMAAEDFKTFAPVAKRMIEVGNHLFKGKTNPTMSLISEALGEEEDAAKLDEAILAKINAALVEMDDSRDVVMHGRETPRFLMGTSYENGSGLVANMVAGLEARLDPKAADAQGREFAKLSIQDIAMNICRARGLKAWDGAAAVRMAAHSTSDFPLVLENSLGNIVARRVEQRAPDLLRASREIPREDYRAGNSLSLSATGMPQEVAEGGEIQAVTVHEKGEALPTVRDFASLFNITNQALVNDRLDLLGDIANKMTLGATERLRTVLLEPLLANAGAGQTMADGKTMFNTAHGNTVSGGAALSITSLTEARVAMRKMRGLNGELLAVEPWALVVPAELETAAQQLVAAIVAPTFDDVNPFAGRLEVIVEPGLTDDGAWYLIGNPARHDGLAHAFLDGQRSPRIESRHGWNTLGMEFRLTWALDAKFIDTASWFRNPGA